MEHKHRKFLSSATGITKHTEIPNYLLYKIVEQPTGIKVLIGEKEVTVTKKLKDYAEIELRLRNPLYKK